MNVGERHHRICRELVAGVLQLHNPSGGVARGWQLVTDLSPAKQVFHIDLVQDGNSTDCVRIHQSGQLRDFDRSEGCILSGMHLS